MKLLLWTVVLLQTVTVLPRTTQGYTVHTGETQGTQNNSRVSQGTQNNNRVSQGAQNNSSVSQETQNKSKITEETEDNSRITEDAQNITRKFIWPKGYRVVCMKTRERLFFVVIVRMCSIFFTHSGPKIKVHSTCIISLAMSISERWDISYFEGDILMHVSCKKQFLYNISQTK